MKSKNGKSPAPVASLQVDLPRCTGQLNRFHVLCAGSDKVYFLSIASMGAHILVQTEECALQNRGRFAFLADMPNSLSVYSYTSYTL